MFDHFVPFTCVTPTPTKRHILGPNHSAVNCQQMRLTEQSTLPQGCHYTHTLSAEPIREN
jgi:hypothetical protein